MINLDSVLKTKDITLLTKVLIHKAMVFPLDIHEYKSRTIKKDSLVAKVCPIFVTPPTVTCWAPLIMRFSRQEYFIGFPFPSPGNLPNPGIKPESPALQGYPLWSEPPGKP